MSKQYRVLKPYKAGLRLYPKRFREAYAEQMLLAAKDILQDAQTRGEKTRTARKLITDLILSLIQENGSHIGAIMKKQIKTMSRKSRLTITVSALQVSGIVAASLVWLGYALFIFNAMSHIGESGLLSSYFWGWAATLIASSLPLLPLPLAFIILRKAAKLSMWQKLMWSYGLGFLGLVCYLFVANLTNAISMRILQHHNYDWAVGLFFLITFCLATSKLRNSARVQGVKYV